MKALQKIVLPSLLGMWVAFAAPVPAQEPEPGRPQEIRVGVYVLNIGKFDVSSGAYTVDFYLSMESDAPFEKNSFEFMNGRGSLELIEDQPSKKFYRIQANLFENVDLKAYPFDRHTLTIEFEEKNNSTDRIVYVPDREQSGIDDMVKFVGWELVRKPRNARVTEHYYPTYKETYSRYVYEIEIRRTALAAILKAFLPVGFILLVGLLSLVIAVDKVPLRFGLNTSTLLAAVMFHLNVTSALPPVGYLTFADKFMIITYGSLILCLGSTLLLMRRTEKGEEAQARRIYRSALMSVPLLTAGMFAALFLLSAI